MTGGKLPDIVANSPELEPGLLYYYIVWQELSNDRQLGFSVGPIPSASIDRFIEQEALSLDDSVDLRHHIRALDRAFLEHCSNQAKAKKDK